MVRFFSFSQILIFATKGLVRGYYFNRLNLTSRFFSKLLSILYKKYSYGLLIKPYKVNYFTKAISLVPIINFFKKNSLIKFNTLTDIFATDHPNALDGRFTVNYCF